MGSLEEAMLKIKLERVNKNISSLENCESPDKRIDENLKNMRKEKKQIEEALK